MNAKTQQQRKVSGKKIYSVVKAYRANDRDVLIVTIPKKLRERFGIKTGREFVVSADDDGRIIYEPND